LSILRYWSLLPEGPAGRDRLVIGNSRGDLRYAANEAKAVAKLLRAEAILGRSVVRYLLEAQIRSSDVFHVAGHIIFNGQIPMFSGIRLADGTVMSVQDLIRSHFAARLAVLSGCESGKTALGYEHEGVSLGISFLHTGARAVIFSLWEVDDRATGELMISFYRHLLAGARPDGALQAAQCALLRRGYYAHPYYWASFQVVGACYTIELARSIASTT
jgi:CHAT domain-containing protein